MKPYYKKILKKLVQYASYEYESKENYVDLNDYLQIIKHDGAYVKNKKDIDALTYLSDHKFIIICNVGCIVTNKGIKFTNNG